MAASQGTVEAEEAWDRQIADVEEQLIELGHPPNLCRQAAESTSGATFQIHLDSAVSKVTQLLAAEDAANESGVHAHTTPSSDPRRAARPERGGPPSPPPVHLLARPPPLARPGVEGGTP